jgi:hypothetical protein
MTQAGDVLAAIVLWPLWNPPRQFVPVSLVSTFVSRGRAGSSGLFDKVTRPSAFGQTGHRSRHRRMTESYRCCRKRDFAMSGEQHRSKIKCKCAILIQKSARWDSIVSNSNSAVRLRRLFRQHRPGPDSECARQSCQRIGGASSPAMPSFGKCARIVSAK